MRNGCEKSTSNLEEPPFKGDATVRNNVWWNWFPKRIFKNLEVL